MPEMRRKTKYIFLIKSHNPTAVKLVYREEKGERGQSLS